MLCFFFTTIKQKRNLICVIFSFRNLSNLPREHLILIDYIMLFIRKMVLLSTNTNRQRKSDVLTIAKYLCGSLFMRPYRPGHKEMVSTIIEGISFSWKCHQFYVLLCASK